MAVRNRPEDKSDRPRCPAVVALAVNNFASEMKRKLWENAHKRHWGDTSQDDLYIRLLEESAELNFAIMTKNHKAVIQEAADVANFAMMLADNARKKL